MVLLYDTALCELIYCNHVASFVLQQDTTHNMSIYFPILQAKGNKKEKRRAIITDSFPVKPGTGALWESPNDPRGVLGPFQIFSRAKKLEVEAGMPRGDVCCTCWQGKNVKTHVKAIRNHALS